MTTKTKKAVKKTATKPPRKNLVPTGEKAGHLSFRLTSAIEQQLTELQAHYVEQYGFTCSFTDIMRAAIQYTHEQRVGAKK